VTIALVAIAMSASLAQASLTVHHPADRAIIGGDGLLHVIAESSADVTVHVNGVRAPSTRRALAGGGAMVHAQLRLVPGATRITIAVPGASTDRTVFFVSGLVRDQTPPPDFERRPFHRRGAEGACSGCHETVPRAEDMQPPSPARSSCYSCHADLVRTTHVHGPAAQWACLRCHADGDGAVRYVTPEPVMPLCVSCHEEQKERFYGERFQHGPTATGMCVLCHSPHGSGHALLLRNAAWELCTACHAEKGSGAHVMAGGASGQSHPTKGKPDPLRTGQELSCASCHNPHAAPAPALWSFKATLWLDLCRNCHGALAGEPAR
jgi:predicted CXXCH cytochrome family protein